VDKRAYEQRTTIGITDRRPASDVGQISPADIEILLEFVIDGSQIKQFGEPTLTFGLALSG
jgi:hypothetical protein